MAFPWAIAAQVVAAAAKAYRQHREAANDAAERERRREEIVAAISRMRQEVIAEVIALRLRELEGEVQGFQDTYATYDPDPNSTVEENRLTRLIDDSIRVANQLGVLVDVVRAEPELGLPAWPPYLSILYLRAQAMTEREYTYGADEIEDILPSFEDALQRMSGVKQYLRDMSDARFGDVVSRQHVDFTETVVGYMFNYNFIFCGYLNRPDSIQTAQEERQRHMDSAFKAYEGVRETLAAIDELQAAIDELTQDVRFGQIAILDPRIQKYLKRLEDGRIAFRGGLPMPLGARHRSSSEREAA